MDKYQLAILDYEKRRQAERAASKLPKEAFLKAKEDLKRAKNRLSALGRSLMGNEPRIFSKKGYSFDKENSLHIFMGKEFGNLKDCEDAIEEYEHQKYLYLESLEDK